MDWNTTGIITALIISVIAPFITAIITNIHQSRFATKEFERKRSSSFADTRLNVFSSCLKEIGCVLYEPSGENLNNMGNHFFQLYLYLPEEHWPLLDSLADVLKSNSNRYPEYANELKELSKVLSKQLQLNTTVVNKAKKN